MPQYENRPIDIAADESLSVRMNHLADQSARKDPIPCGSPRFSGCKKQTCLVGGARQCMVDESKSR
jgi:hypothetical protein